VRTTVDIDPILLERLQREARRANISFTRLVNRVLQRGLSEPAQDLPPLDDVFPASDMGVRAGVSIDQALKLAAELEDVGVRDKLESRK
jgi:hypothetical protein